MIMNKRLLKKTIAIALVFAMVLGVSIVAAYGSTPFSVNPLISDTESTYGIDGLMAEPTIVEPLSGDSTNEMVIEPGLGGGSTGTYNYVWSTYNLSTKNCYGYAIGENVAINPGTYCNIPLNSYKYNISVLCDAVIGDLQALGHTNATEVSASYVPSSSETKIAFRLGYDSNGTYVDYHFMVWKPAGYWLHKPGSTAVLQYKYTNLSSAWVPEAYYNYVWYIDYSFTYNGTVKYVVY